jgi:hypothetical protein
VNEKIWRGEKERIIRHKEREDKMDKERNNT